ncbi:MAG: methionine biosynthesis protein MetW [Lentisphaeria bacterium]|nr:methionine biosynthesis protein MetW [Lentisphaeria bacterium]
MADYDLNRRRDLEVISDLVRPGDRVLDIGCVDGKFLRHLKDEKQADVLGLELDTDSIARCISNGVPVVQAEFDDKLEFADDNSFDLVVVSHTLQEMRNPELILKHILRAGKRAAVSVINFGHWNCRLQLLFKGRMPRNTRLPYQWYNTPNIHLGTLHDFRDLCKTLGVKIISETPIAARFPRLTAVWPNWFAVGCVFVLEKFEDKAE